MLPDRELDQSPPSARDVTLGRLAEQYHERCEAYDRTVCIGNEFGSLGGVIPSSPYELKLVNRNAHAVFNELAQVAARHGITRAELRQAVQSYHPVFA